MAEIGAYNNRELQPQGQNFGLDSTLLHTMYSPLMWVGGIHMKRPAQQNGYPQFVDQPSIALEGEEPGIFLS